MSDDYDPLAPKPCALDQIPAFREACREWEDDSPEAIARFRADLDHAFRYAIPKETQQ